MQCPDCGFVLTDFETECLRCKKFGKPVPKEVPARRPEPTSLPPPSVPANSSVVWPTQRASNRRKMSTPAIFGIVFAGILILGAAVVTWHDSYYEDGHNPVLVAEESMIDNRHGAYLKDFGLNVCRDEPYVDTGVGTEIVVVIPYQEDRYGPMHDVTVTLTPNERTGKWQTVSYTDLLGNSHPMEWQWRKP